MKEAISANLRVWLNNICVQERGTFRTGKEKLSCQRIRLLINCWRHNEKTFTIYQVSTVHVSKGNDAFVKSTH